ncbi:MAG: DMT family transporter [Planctomycetes bacterium]|jgi:drug/metabolite transporter (DMT)-like permease|nr:DMT family transporter [Planctomycetota bacterium]MCL4729799.1 DMT family transporter [Planctomycetota bacterium]
MRALPTLALVVGVLAVSTAPVLILLTGLDPYALAAWRLVCVALILTPLGGWRLWRDLKKLSVRDRLLLVTSGVLYGAHFGLFNLAFFHTSKESVVVLLAVQPLMAAAIGALWLNERFTATMFWASLVATAGLTVFVWHDYTFDAAHLVGDALVIACGLAIVLSYSFGRVLRPRMSLGGYLGALYWIGGLTMLATALVAGNPLWGYAQDQWFWLALAVLIPTLVGHSLFHYVVRYVPVFYVNLTILGEPILSLLIMYALRDHYTVFATSTMTPLQIAGGSLLLLGVGIGLAFGRKDAAKERGS